MNKTLLAALALSPSSKAITVVDEKQWLIIERVNNGEDSFYRIHLVNMQEGDVTHCSRPLAGFADMQSWVDNCVFDADNIDVMDKRWKCLEEAVERQGCAER